MGLEYNDCSPKRKRRKMCMLSAKVRFEITKMAAAKVRSQREIGELFNVPTRIVSTLSSAMKRSKPNIKKR